MTGTSGGDARLSRCRKPAGIPSPPFPSGAGGFCNTQYTERPIDSRIAPSRLHAITVVRPGSHRWFTGSRPDGGIVVVVVRELLPSGALLRVSQMTTIPLGTPNAPQRRSFGLPEGAFCVDFEFPNYVFLLELGG